MKDKIINSYKDGKNSYVTKQTKYGTFHGKVTLADEDIDVESELDGFLFAEYKCDIQAAKKKVDIFYQRMLGMRHAYNVLEKSGIYQDDPTLKKLKRQLAIAEREYERQEAVYKGLVNHYKPYVELVIEARRDFNKKYKNK